MNTYDDVKRTREHIRNRRDVETRLRRQLADVESDIRASEREIHEWKLSQIIRLPVDDREYIELVWPVFIGGPCSEQEIVPDVLVPTLPEILCADAPRAVIDSIDFRSPEPGEDPRERTATYRLHQFRHSPYLGTRIVIIVAYAYAYDDGQKQPACSELSKALYDTLGEGHRQVIGRRSGFRMLTRLNPTP